MSTFGSNPGALSSPDHAFPLGDELRGERATLGKTLLDVQRDLRIRAAYIAAIEDASPEVFPNPAFVPGYVRSYARYLSLDVEEVYRRFCHESGFSPARSTQSVGKSAAAPGPQSSAGVFRPDFPLANLPRAGLPAIPFSALGSLAVLIALVAGLGYGGWTVLQNIQRVQFAPVEEIPLAVAEMEPLEVPAGPGTDEPMLSELASPVAATSLADLYRHQELEVPILVPRDGPIAAINPDRIGPLAELAPAAMVAASGTAQPKEEAILQMVRASVEADDVAPGTGSDGAELAALPLTVVAERAAWIRVYLDNGTILFESILEKGQTYSPPEGVASPLRIWAGNAGSVYVRVGDALHGPLGSGTRAARDVVLEPQAIVDRYALVEQIPEVISQTIGIDAARTGAAVALR